MGAQAFIVENEAASAYEAYNNLVAIAIQGHGDDSYNGTISTRAKWVDVQNLFLNI